MLEIPESFDALEKIFKESEDDAPCDIQEYLDEPIFTLIKRLGNSIRRWTRFEDLDAPETVLAAEEGLARKYHTAIKMRANEFTRFVRKMDTGAPKTKGWIMARAPLICAAIANHLDPGGERLCLL